MLTLPKLVMLAGPLLLLVLTAVAGYAYSQIRYLSLPIPQALALFSVILPLITGVSIHGVYNLIKHKDDQNQLTIPLMVVIGFQLIYETIIGTLALTHMIPPNSLHCELSEKWGTLFSQRNSRAISDIQNSFNCCGFNTVKDRSFPWNSPSACSTDYGRDKSCYMEWRKAEQVNAGLFLLVAIIVFIVKVVSLLFLLTSSSSTNTWARHFKRGRNGDSEDTRAAMRRLIEEGADEAYSDEPRAENGEGQSHGPIVQPSLLQGAGREWRNEG